MNTPLIIQQEPPPGSRMVLFRGDTVRFTLSVSRGSAGKAWVRTNIGHAVIARQVTIHAVEKNIPPLGEDWFDIPMRQLAPDQFTALLPLHEVGHFEAKCFFMPLGEKIPLWPAGPNTSVNVEPAGVCSANIIYNAFVRQFGPNKDGRQFPDDDETDCTRKLDHKHYTVIPRSGTFRDLIAELDFIIGRLGCRFVHLLPISPTPTTYGRMGRFGSPYAALHFTGIDPALAVFDLKATPLDQFIELADAVHARHAGLLIDIAVNHTGWAASLHETHPHWLLRDAQGGIHSPGAWGVVWKDLTSLDYSQKDLWKYIARVFLTWCRRGVDGFRCDAGYMIPLSAWSYIIARVREQFPETIFFLEGLGGKVSVTRDLLNLANFNWAYSELFQNYDRRQIENYLPEAIDISLQDGIAVHYAETHDNNRLAARSPVYAKMRTALCALCASRGGFGFANGVEWFADTKINVHEAHPLNWGSAVNQVDAIRRINMLLRFHPAFHEEVNLRLITQGEGNCMALRRLHQPSGKKLIIVANLDDEHPVEASWEIQQDMIRFPPIDLLTGQETNVLFNGETQTCKLLPGQVLCLTADRNDLKCFEQPDNLAFEPDHLLDQKKTAKVLDVLCHDRGMHDISDWDLKKAVDFLTNDPVEFCRSCNPQSEEHRIAFWHFPSDLHREVMIPPGHFLLIEADDPFRAMILDGDEESERVMVCEESLPAAKGGHFVLLVPIATRSRAQNRTLKLTVYEKSGIRHEQSPLLFLIRPGETAWQPKLSRNDLSKGRHLFLSTNGIGGMCRADVRWGVLNSKYDALLAANLDPDYPVDRWVLFTRCRAWIVYQGYSQEICFDSLDYFRKESHRGVWNYKIPTGQGQRIDLQMTLQMVQEENTVCLTFQRMNAGSQGAKLADNEAVRLILRPDIEDRNFHETTKAYKGPETAWPSAVTFEPFGFVFTPSPYRQLALRISGGSFVPEPQWHYMVHHPADEERGMDPLSDLWSPGYFTSILLGNDAVCLTASANQTVFPEVRPPEDISGMNEKRLIALEKSLADTLADYIVRRGDLKSVIAGYPWFLDWGRDSLIFVRGLIRCGRMAEAEAILKFFGEFEENGTLPNMIHGGQTGNRTTSDAPLWFVIACADLMRTKRATAFLHETCGGRSLRDILLSIGRSYVEGTPVGVRMDPGSSLIYSPACFSWMDTNHPACTPREGYCVEIQALWHAALVFLSAVDPENPFSWEKTALSVQRSLLDLFVLPEGYLADCLRTSRHAPAKSGVPDHALRPNQLLAITLGAVSDQKIGRTVVDACQMLLIPGAIRSLADRPESIRQEMPPRESANGFPRYPYRGRYTGDENTGRKPAYHNGTAWTWLFPSYCEAYLQVYGEKGKAAVRSLLSSSLAIIREDCIGHFPEILDGDYPHTPRGCDAQAWGLSEWLRVWNLSKKG